MGKSVNSVRLEATSMCQLKCPACSTGIGINRKGTVGWGHLSFRDFKQLIDGNPEVKKVELSNWGEIFLNPELTHIMEYAYRKDVSLTAENGVNLNTVSEEMMDGLVKFKFKLLIVALDGASHETYKIYRKGGDFEKVIKNVERINYYKEQYSSEFPKLRWQFIVFGHNEHELPAAREMAQQLGMEFTVKLNHTPSFSPINDKECVRRESGLGVASREEFKEKMNKQYSLPCYQLWIEPQINWDGKLLGCCVNKYSDFGNVFEAGLKAALKNERFVYTKKMLLGKKTLREDTPCANCHFFEKFKEGVYS
jgi:MoaA/NifB/PqqE/SkfB family radical SAM enzyme